MATNDVLIGPGRVYIAPVGETEPDETSVGFGTAWGGNWVDLGDIKEGSPVTITVEEEFVEANGEQSVFALRVARSKRTVTVKMDLLEASVTNLSYALDATATTTPPGTGQKGFSEITISDKFSVSEYALGVEAMRLDSSGNEQPYRLFLNKVVIRMAGDMPFSKGDTTVIPIEAMMLSDGTTTPGKYQVVTAPAT